MGKKSETRWLQNLSLLHYMVQIKMDFFFPQILISHNNGQLSKFSIQSVQFFKQLNHDLFVHFHKQPQFSSFCTTVLSEMNSSRCKDNCLAWKCWITISLLPSKISHIDTFHEIFIFTLQTWKEHLFSFQMIPKLCESAYRFKNYW